MDNCEVLRAAESGYCPEHKPPAPNKSVTASQMQAKVTCPHCHVQGQVVTKRTKVKKGVSGGKATGAVLTGGLSLLATGLSRKEELTEAKCGNCGIKWTL
jgi:transcription elongation factor Elf1